MPLPVNREEFKDYVMRRLGAPVITVNLDEDQVEDRIDDALNMWYDFHYDSKEKFYLKHQITAEDKENGYITVPDNIIGVMKIFPLYASAGRVGDIFDIQYQIALNDLYSLTTVSMVPYFATMQHLQFMQDMLKGQTIFRYTRTKNRVYLDTNWDILNEGMYLVFETFKIIDPTEYPDIWKDRWFAAYATCLCRLQWGDNLSKLAGVQLPGGVTLDGPAIIQRALAEKAELEEELKSRYELPPMDMVG